MSLRLVYEACKSRLPMSYEQFAESMRGFEVIPVHGGAILVRGNEIHVGVIPDASGRWLSRKVLRQTLGKIISEYGVAVTSVMLDNERGQEFVERLGFIKISSEEGRINYELRQFRF